MRSRLATGVATLAAVILPAGAAAQFHAPVAFVTASNPAGNVDSCAVWVAPPPGPSLLFVTEKEGDRIQVLDASTGAPYAPRPFLGGVLDGSGPGELNRPNGVLVVYRIPVAGGFLDALFVTDQINRRVQAFRLPELDPCGVIGAEEIGKGYGLAAYHDGASFYLIVTDNSPPATAPGKIKKYRLRAEGQGIGADLVLGVGSTGGDPSLPNVESIAADPFHDRLLVCGDEGGRVNRTFRLDGTWTGSSWGDPQFEGDQEGINIYETAGGGGFLVISDQHTDGTPNQFEIFDRATLAPLGNFQSDPDGPAITKNTDGAWLEGRPLPGFPGGAFYAVNDDRNTHAYDWVDIASAAGLAIAPPDRSFPCRPPADGPGAPSRKALWHDDGTWWGAFDGGGGTRLHRLEDGIFVPLSMADPEGREVIAAVGAGRIVLLIAGGPAPAALVLARDPLTRRHRSLGAGEALPAGVAAGADAEIEDGGGEEALRGWIAWTGGGEVLVAASGTGLTGWDSAAVALGPADAAVPRLVRSAGRTGTVWSASDGVWFRSHADGDPPGAWSPAERVSPGPATSLAAAAAPDGRIVVCAASGESARVATRGAAGGWGESELTGDAPDPALAIDGTGGKAYLLSAGALEGRRVIRAREASLSDLTFGPPRLAVAWPGVDQVAILHPATVPPDAVDLVACGAGDDGLARFERRPLARDGDVQAPAAFALVPGPGASGVEPGATLSFRLTDDRAGVDRSGLTVLVDGRPIVPVVRGVPRSLLVSLPLPGDVGPDASIRIEARDRSTPSRAMDPIEYRIRVGETAVRFRRGDANEDGDPDVSDALRILFALFTGAQPLDCEDAADADDDGSVGVTDVVLLLAFLFQGGAAPPPPGDCGPDPTGDSLRCEGSPGCDEAAPGGAWPAGDQRSART